MNPKPKHFIYPTWPAPENIQSATSLRTLPGYSQYPYHLFNVAEHVGDDPSAVAKNRELLQQQLELPSEPYWLNQVHGTHVALVEGAHQKEDADASITRLNNHVLAIMSADCLPILICNQAGDEIAAIHAGWRGLLHGIILQTITRMYTPGHRLLAWLGPAIGPVHLQLSQEIRQLFLHHNPDYNQAFYQDDKQHWFANIYLLARIALNKLGVTAIYGGEYCTFEDSELFYSHRRDKGQTGRMVSVIWMGN